MSTHYGMVNWYSHGNLTFFGVKAAPYGGVWGGDNYCLEAGYCSDEEGDGFDNMTNANYYAIAYSIACSIGAFDLPQFIATQRSPVEAWTYLYPRNCGPAALANTRWGWQDASPALQRQFADLLTSEGHNPESGESYLHLGVSELVSKQIYSATGYYGHYLAYAHNLFGCPEEKIWTALPSQFLNASIIDSGNYITVFTGTTNADIAAISGNNGASFSEVAHDVSGYTFSTSVRPLYITISKTNHIPYTAVTGGTFSSNETWFGNIKVLGPITVSTTLTISPGTAVLFSPTASLVVDGTLLAVGEEGTRIAFVPSETGQGWKGIRMNSARAHSRIEYADITEGLIGIALSHRTGASVTNCSITGGKIGISVFDAPGPEPLLSTGIQHNQISGCRIVGISVGEDVYNVTMQDNTLQGNSNDDVGLQFIGASPLEVVRNSVREFGKYGIQCINASPSFIDGTEEGGRSCFVDNRIGVHGEVSANFILGLVNGENGTSSGNNTIAFNEQYEIELVEKCVAYSQSNYHYDRRFNIDESSMLVYEPDLNEDPNGCEGGAAPVFVSNGATNKNEPPSPLAGLSGIGNPLVKQAIRLRLQRQHVAAIVVLKELIASNTTSIELKRWGLHELLANYQLIPNPSGSNVLSGYLRDLLQTVTNAQIRQALRDVLAGALRHQRDYAATLAALDTNIQQYPSTPSELLALFGKVSLAVNVLEDHALAHNTLQAMQLRYPTHSLTFLASVLVNEAGSMRAVANPISSLSSTSPEKPMVYALEQNYPNPFNPSTTIKYQLPQAGQVLIKLYDVLGREVKTLLNEEKEVGYHQLTIDASPLASGVYFYRLQSGGFTNTKKLLFIK